MHVHWSHSSPNRSNGSKGPQTAAVGHAGAHISFTRSSKSVFFLFFFSKYARVEKKYLILNAKFAKVAKAGGCLKKRQRAISNTFSYPRNRITRLHLHLLFPVPLCDTLATLPRPAPSLTRTSCTHSQPPSPLPQLYKICFNVLPVLLLDQLGLSAPFTKTMAKSQRLAGLEPASWGLQWPTGCLRKVSCQHTSQPPAPSLSPPDPTSAYFSFIHVTTFIFTFCTFLIRSVF